MLDDMIKVTQRVSQPVTILGRAALVRISWDKFLWLLEEYERYVKSVPC